jgi:hypothetical protein
MVINLLLLGILLRVHWCRASDSVQTWNVLVHSRDFRGLILLTCWECVGEFEHCCSQAASLLVDQREDPGLVMTNIKIVNFSLYTLC